MLFTDAFSIYWNEMQTSIVPSAIRIAIELSPIALAFILYNVFWSVWLRYVRARQFLGLKFTVLEIKLPRETHKSPLAMEVFLNGLHNTSDGSKYAQYWKGETRPWYSLEIASFEGQVKFFIWTEDRRKKGLMYNLYGQFPEAEVIEREDYAKAIDFDPKTMKLYAAEFKFTKDDPYPIKTYIDYGLDKDPKEEYKVDPIVPMIEWLGTLGPNQQAWIQIPIRAHIADQRAPGHLFKRTDLWKDKAVELINKELKRDPKTKVAGEEDEETGLSKRPMITKGEEEVVGALERSISKLAFDCGIRALYISPKDTFDTPHGIGGIISSFKHYSTAHLNGFKPNGDKWIAQFDYPWQDYKNIRRNRLSRQVIKAYRRRSYFYPPFQSKSLVMTTEELATIYHFPGSVASTPTLERIPSKKTAAPANLPI